MGVGPILTLVQPCGLCTRVDNQRHIVSLVGLMYMFILITGVDLTEYTVVQPKSDDETDANRDKATFTKVRSLPGGCP